MKLPNEVQAFLESKQFSKNTKANYLYDLRHLMAFFEDQELSDESLKLYKKSLGELSATAQRRKISSTNQYLSYLYQQKKIDSFFKMTQVAAAPSASNPRTVAEIQDFSSFYKPLTVTSPGHFLALVILEFGLNFSEIQQLRWEDFNWNFKVLTIEKSGIKRVLPIDDRFALMVKQINNADELFTKSRQFLYLELKKYTPITAKALREQYILRQVAEGKTIYELAQNLGLLTIYTLEKYYR
ncbi:site-specific tyrosine recombinase XerD [Lactococcus termiticola]|uniref:Tyrosine recombinase XerD n=1 Tax=Lactococcus termiticola TaxID=2169526 RepID=A0A2R5HGK3_9LACT|nr:site-specific tyrosine recombinase XerD [Lactococcus termiticola]GBG97193.1 tyrosine recombinase XerD [Lactococcus termiticola]